jgi:phenylacetate-CoA ligase
MRGYLKKLLRIMPASLEDFSKAAYRLLPPSIRHGKAYRDALALFRDSDEWDLQTLERYQEWQLRKLISHCYQNVPYYREVFRKASLAPQDIVTVQDLQKLPFLTKEIVRERKQELLAVNIGQAHQESVETSGSTGAPLDFWISTDARAFERALLRRHLHWLGYEPGDVIAQFKSELFANPDQVYSYTPTSRILRLSARSVAHQALESIVATLQKFKPTFLQAFPSSLYILTRWMEANNKSIPRLKYAMTSSEMLYPHTKELAEKVLGVPVIAHYGQKELVAEAFQCAKARGYHIQMEQNLVELMPAEHGQFEIVGTSLHNFAMPFVRYRTGDLAEGKDKPECCGRNHTVLSGIVGRQGDIVVTPERRFVSVPSMTHPFRHIEGLNAVQIIQEDLKTLVVNIVTLKQFPDDKKRFLANELHECLQSPTMKILIVEVEDLPVINNGKRPFIVSRLQIDDYICFD